MSKDPTNQRESSPTGSPGTDRLPLESQATAIPDAAGTADVCDHPCLDSKPDAESDGNTSRAVETDRDASGKPGNRGLPSRNIVIDRKRTSIRLDTYSLDSLYEIAMRERISVNELCTLIHERNKNSSFTLTAAIRIFLLSYFRAAATDDGHRLANHGRDHPLAGTPFDPSPPVQPTREVSSGPPRRRTKAPPAADAGAGRPRRASDSVIAETVAAT
jgi:predicted DNA-binding ribbon-helix-helix protein